MTMLILGLILFLGAHLARVIAPEFRVRMIGRLGEWGWKGLYSAVSLAGFVLLVAGYASARWSSPVLWGPPPPFLRMAVTLLMLPVLVVFLSAYLPGRLRAWIRHPMTFATVAWAALHLLVNGRVADLLLFGAFFAWAHVVLIAAFRRPHAPPAKAPSLVWDGVALVAGAAVWWWLIFGHGHALLFTMPVMTLPPP
jgi:uncharacterized membrane protein